MRRPSRQLSLKECYEVLRLDKGADLQAVKRAYRRRAFELHPDLNPGNPEAGRQFQLLNEAYVALTALLKPEEDARRAAEAQKKAESSQAEAAGEKAQAQGTAGASEGPTGNASEAGAEGQQAGQEQAGHNRDGERAQKAYAEQDVLRDLLNDPFARRVFEDIYSELNRQQAGPRPTPEEEPRKPQQPRREQPRKQAQPRKNTKLHQGNIAWGTPNWNRDLNKGVTGVVKDWLRRQIDEEQTLRFPAAHLVPGRRIRLQIRRGLSDELHTVEVTLPQDFTPGKPVRLKGLGKRVGPWQGDLYLTIYSE